MHPLEGPIRKRAHPSASNLLHCSGASHEWRLFKSPPSAPGNSCSAEFFGFSGSAAIPSSPRRPPLLPAGIAAASSRTKVRAPGSCLILLHSVLPPTRVFLWSSPGVVLLRPWLVLHVSEECRGDFVSWFCSSSLFALRAHPFRLFLQRL